VGDIRDAFAEFVDAQWPAVDSFMAPPPYIWPKSPVPVILSCWKRFRARVLQGQTHIPRDALVETAKWVKVLLSSVRRCATDVQRYHPWISQLGHEMCLGRLEWTERYWWTCRNEDRAWARNLNKNAGPTDATIEPPERYTPDDLPLGLIKKELGIRSGLVPVTRTRDGMKLESKHRRCAWVSWPKDIDCPELWATARTQVGRIRPSI